MVKTTAMKVSLRGIVTRPKCLDDENISKIKKAFEKSFPEIPDVSKV
jgi:hypothetical protein